jgi:hypothetical protein
MKQIKTSIAVFIGILGSIIFPTVLHTRQNEFAVLKGPYLGQKPPGKTPEIFAAGIISPEEGYHSSPVFSPDGKEVYWATMTSGILYMTINDGSWTVPKNLGPKVNTANHEICPIISPEGKYLFFLKKHGVYWVDTKIIDELRPKE